MSDYNIPHTQRYIDALAEKLSGCCFIVPNVIHSADIERNKLLDVRLYMPTLHNLGPYGVMFVYHTLAGGLIAHPRTVRSSRRYST